MKWTDVTADTEHATQLRSELERELEPGHALFGKDLQAVLARVDADDVIFQQEQEFFLVRLTWSGHREPAPDWPAFVRASTLVEAKLAAEAE